jgi:hypothetical protein
MVGAFDVLISARQTFEGIAWAVREPVHEDRRAGALWRGPWNGA